MGKIINEIKLGYEVKTGEVVTIKNSHLIVTGLTQEAGKTTTLEALIKRSGKRAIVFKTKVGEKSFLEGTIIPPYFRERSDWQFIQGLIEATIKEKMRSFERAKIIQLCKKTNGKSLLEFKKKVDERLLEKINGFEMDILTNIQAYLEIVLPKLQSINFSKELELNDGLNIIDLERFSRDSEVQSLIIRSVLEEVLYKFKDVIVVIPEAWKFVPQGRGNPCKQAMEEFIRQGATNNNFIWIDSQDMSNVDKVPLKQISTWIMGYQSERNEVKHTIDQIPLPKKSKPTPDDIQSLGKGIFYLATREKTIKTYVQPYWLDDKIAIKVALGKLKIEDIDAPQTLSPFKVVMKKEVKGSEVQTIDFSETTKRFTKEMNEVRTDFFNKIEEIQEQFNKVYTEIFELKNQPKQEIDEETLINKILQKLPSQNNNLGAQIPFDKDAIIKEILLKIPKSTGNTVYEVAPLKKITKDFLEEAKNKILSDIERLSLDGKKALKYLESRGVQMLPGEIINKGFLLKSGGNNSVKVSNALKENLNLGVVFRNPKGKYNGTLKERITGLLLPNQATEQEIEQVYNHILMEMLK